MRTGTESGIDRNLGLQEKMQELQTKLGKFEEEKAELERRHGLLSSACQLRDEELRKVLPTHYIPLLLTKFRSKTATTAWSCHR